MSNYIYKKLSETNCAYLLKSGTIRCEIFPEETFDISGKNLIFGAQELLLTLEDKFMNYRLFNVLPTSNCEYKTLEKDKIVQGLNNYKAVFNMSRVIAMSLIYINKILTKMKQAIGEKDRLSREYCKIYAYTIDLLEEHKIALFGATSGCSK